VHDQPSLHFKFKLHPPEYSFIKTQPNVTDLTAYIKSHLLSAHKGWWTHVYFNFSQALGKVLHNDLLNKPHKLIFCIYCMASELHLEVLTGKIVGYDLLKIFHL
jgi:hypothetical protein